MPNKMPQYANDYNSENIQYKRTFWMGCYPLPWGSLGIFGIAK